MIHSLDRRRGGQDGPYTASRSVGTSSYLPTHRASVLGRQRVQTHSCPNQFTMPTGKVLFLRGTTSMSRASSEATLDSFSGVAHERRARDHALDGEGGPDPEKTRRSLSDFVCARRPRGGPDVGGEAQPAGPAYLMVPRTGPTRRFPAPTGNCWLGDESALPPPSAPRRGSSPRRRGQVFVSPRPDDEIELELPARWTSVVFLPAAGADDLAGETAQATTHR